MIVARPHPPCEVDLWHTVPIAHYRWHSNIRAIHNFHRSIHISYSREKRTEQQLSDQ